MIATKYLLRLNPKMRSLYYRVCDIQVEVRFLSEEHKIAQDLEEIFEMWARQEAQKDFEAEVYKQLNNHSTSTIV